MVLSALYPFAESFKQVYRLLAAAFPNLLESSTAVTLNQAGLQAKAAARKRLPRLVQRVLSFLPASESWCPSKQVLP